MTLALKDHRPLKNLKIKVPKKELLRRVQEGYKKCSNVQSDVLDVMNQRASSEMKVAQFGMMIDQKKREIEELEKAIEKEKETFQNTTEALNKLQDGMESISEEFLAELVQVLWESIPVKARDEINTGIRNTGAFKKKDIKHFLEMGVQDEFDVDFIEKVITIVNPSPLLTKVLMRKEYEERERRYLELKKKSKENGESKVKKKPL